jgi:hypothetical protein
MFFVIPGSVWFSSEMKALSDDCERFISFPPEHLYSSKTGSIVLLHLCKIDDLMRHYTFIPEIHLHTLKAKIVHQYVANIHLFCLLICSLTYDPLGSLRRWYNPPWFSESIPSAPYDPLLIRESFEKVAPFIMPSVTFSHILMHKYKFIVFSYSC